MSENRATYVAEAIYWQTWNQIGVTTVHSFDRSVGWCYCLSGVGI